MRPLALVALLASAVTAQEAKGFARQIVGDIQAGWSKTANIDYVLDNDAYEVLSKAPKYAADVCAAAAKHVRTDSIREERWDRLVAFLMRTTERCLGLAPKDADALRAAADAHLTRARMAKRLDRKPRAADWLKAVDLLMRLHQHQPDEGKTLSRAVRILLDEHHDAKKLGKVCEVGRKACPKVGLFRLPTMRAQLDAATDGDALKKLLDRWKPLAETYDDTLLALYNEAVTVAKRRKLKTKHDWLRHTKRRFTEGVMFDVPWYRWVGHRDLKQYDRDGTVQATITIARESDDYTTKFVKARAELLKNQIGGTFTLKPAKRRLNKHFRRCFSFEMGGNDRNGDFVHCRVFFVRTVSDMRDDVTRIEIRSRSAAANPEIDLILATMRRYSLKPGK